MTQPTHQDRRVLGDGPAEADQLALAHAEITTHLRHVRVKPTLRQWRQQYFTQSVLEHDKLLVLCGCRNINFSCMHVVPFGS